MFECLIMGDSIAVGTAHFRKECVTIAKSGINSGQYLTHYISNTPFDTKTAIISLGANDSPDQLTYENLQKIRAKVNAERVYWILPAGNLKGSEVPIEHVQNIVTELAAQYGDVVLPITKISSDKIHPSKEGYKDLAEKTR